MSRAVVLALVPAAAGHREHRSHDQIGQVLMGVDVLGDASLDAASDRARMTAEPAWYTSVQTLKSIVHPESGYAIQNMGKDLQRVCNGDSARGACFPMGGGTTYVEIDSTICKAGVPGSECAPLPIAQCTVKIDGADWIYSAQPWKDVDPLCFKADPNTVLSEDPKYEPKDYESFQRRCLNADQEGKVADGLEPCKGMQTDRTVGAISHSSHEGQYVVQELEVPTAAWRAGGAEGRSKVRLPLSPAAKDHSTGFRGRGRLGRWGPNFAADPIVTRWNSGTKEFEVAVVVRKDTLEFALPGGMVEPGDSVAKTIKKEFVEEAMGDFEVMDSDDKDKIFNKIKGRILSDARGEFTASEEEKDRAVARYHKWLTDNRDFLKVLDGCASLAQEHHVVYQGIVDDYRNTDNAWMETQAVWLHCNACPLPESLKSEHESDQAMLDKVCDKVSLSPADDAAAAAFKPVNDVDKLFASHAYMLKPVLDTLKTQQDVEKASRTATETQQVTTIASTTGAQSPAATSEVTTIASTTGAQSPAATSEVTTIASTTGAQSPASTSEAAKTASAVATTTVGAAAAAITTASPPAAPQEAKNAGQRPGAASLVALLTTAAATATAALRW